MVKCTFCGTSEDICWQSAVTHYKVCRECFGDREKYRELSDATFAAIEKLEGVRVG